MKKKVKKQKLEISLEELRSIIGEIERRLDCGWDDCWPTYDEEKIEITIYEDKVDLRIPYEGTSFQTFNR